MGFLDYILSLNQKPQPQTPIMSIDHDKLIAAVNAQRLKFGFPAYQKSNSLEAVAQDWANKLGVSGRLSHGDFEGRIQHAIPHLSYYGEDIASGQRTIEEVMKSWMNSPPHRANILHRLYTEIGVGIAFDVQRNTYWVLDFDRLKD